MRHRIAALGAVLAAFAASAGTALASGPVQSATQSATTDQGALAASSATQVQPTNTSYSIRVLSPGNDGPVSQSNTASSSALAANVASTTQTADQTQSAGCGCEASPLQSIVQAAQAGQLSGVLSGAAQLAAGNSAGPASVASPGGGGSTQQANGVDSSGVAANAAPTAQSASQQSGGGVQSSDQSAATDQAAGAASSATQEQPSNTNISVRVLSPGDNGAVRQSNDASSSAAALNAAGTAQDAQQSQAGGGGVQSSTQDAATGQDALAASKAVQVQPSNTNISVRVLSPGNDGAVRQSNDVSSAATAANLAPVSQTASQSQAGPSCGCMDGGAPSVQAIGQQSSTEQAAGAASAAEQVGASNTNDPVRIWSPGDGGSVSQSNTASSDAAALNGASTSQSADQQGSAGSCGCGSDPAVQALGQSRSTGQEAGALSGVLQAGAQNSSDPVRVWSDGNDGRLSQRNDASSSALAGNAAATDQTAAQQQAGSGIQALGQEASTGQAAFASSVAAQLPGREQCGCQGSSFGNTSAPVRIGSSGDGGSVRQSNDASSRADATNAAGTSQAAQQSQSGHGCGCSGPGVQALGQQAATDQLAAGLSEVWQFGAFNTYRPTAVWSLWGGGATWQTNRAASAATAPNRARTVQLGAQME